MAALIEVCVDSVESAAAADNGGADRLELCQALPEGGLTPTSGLLRQVRRRTRLPIAVMIRPRGADFCYSDDELEVMRQDLLVAKDLGADLIVLGLLQPDGAIDVDHTREFIQLARPLPVTFHRAFDMVRDPAVALEQLAELGVARVLTSGQAPDAETGLDLLAQLVRQSAGRIIIMPGGGIHELNVARILNRSGATEFHTSATVTRQSDMRFRNPRVAMGRGTSGAEYEWKVASATRLSQFRQEILKSTSRRGPAA